MPLLADELVRLKPNVIIVTGSTDAVLAVMQATAAIPIVSPVLSEAAAFGLVESQARPGDQVTGILTTFQGLTGKQLELLHELVPGATRIGMTLNTRMRAPTVWQQEVKAAANALGVTLVPVDIRTANHMTEIDGFNEVRNWQWMRARVSLCAPTAPQTGRDDC